MKALAVWLVGLSLIAWVACAAWNSFKPLPSGVHVTSLPVRMAELQVQFIDDGIRGEATLARQVAAVARAEQGVVLDECPLPPELSAALLARKRQHPNLAVLLVTDPRSEIYGGTRSTVLDELEREGIVVSRTRLQRLRDSNPLYSSFWRLAVEWWSDPYAETSGGATPVSALRQRNLKFDERRVLVADDGAGGWTSIVSSGATAGVALELRGHLARDIAASEIKVAEWSTHEDRLPPAPPIESRGVGTIDARFLTEGAIHASMLDVVALAVRGDSIQAMARSLDDRGLIDAMVQAAERNARLELLLAPELPATQAAAAELLRRANGQIDIRWQSGPAADGRFALLRHRNDVWLDLTSADFTRRSLDDLNLEAGVELHMPASVAPARAAQDFFARAWASSAPYSAYSDDSRETYWRYRFTQFTGLTIF